MGASGLGWTVTVVLLAGLAVVDYAFRVRPAHSPTLHGAAAWSALYVGLAVLFGVGVTVVGDAAAGVEYFACYLSNEALSVDNLFVFLVIVGGFAVPRIAQQKVLLFGIVIAVLARTGFIFVGAAVVNTFSWAFYLFALVLFAAAGSLVTPSAPQGRGAGGAVLRVAKRFLRTSERYHGDRLFVAENGRRVMTPMLLAMIAVGGADLVFAFDSIPALFGLSQNVYLIFTATTFSLLGLRQLYFLLDGLLDRLVYLSYGLAGILGFIGVTLTLQALGENSIAFVNDGKPVPVDEVSTSVSLVVIVVILLVTTAASLLSPRGRAKSVVTRARRHAAEYLDAGSDVDPAERERTFTRLLADERHIDAFPARYRSLARDELTTLIERAHRVHDA